MLSLEIYIKSQGRHMPCITLFHSATNRLYQARPLRESQMLNLLNFSGGWHQLQITTSLTACVHLNACSAYCPEAVHTVQKHTCESSVLHTLANQALQSVHCVCQKAFGALPQTAQT